MSTPPISTPDSIHTQAYRGAPELVFGVVGSVGTRLTRTCDQLDAALREVNYDTRTIRLSDLLHSVTPTPPWSPPLSTARSDIPRDRDIRAHQDAGDRLRRLTGRGDALAILGIAEIRNLRRTAHGEPLPISNATDPESELAYNVQDALIDWQASYQTPLARTAFVLKSLKHPDEARALRKIYGRRFYLIAAHVPLEMAIDDLGRQIAASEHDEYDDSHRHRARDLYEREADPENSRTPADLALQQSEDDPFNALGQNVRDTYRHADFFIDARGDTDHIFDQLKRLVKLVFGDPFVTPTPDEQAMEYAYVASMRSSAFSRQVGAVITDARTSVVAVGTNEVPKAHGGAYWPDDDPDGRDFNYHGGDDSTDLMRRSILRETLDRLEQLHLLDSDDRAGVPLNDLVAALRSARVWRPTEFGRPVHAEMAAITDAARRGVPLQDCTLYTTTYPCHGCARHILAAGIRKVVYVEPYAKSLTHNLHEDAIATDPVEPSDSRVIFSQFIGVACRRFADLFERTEGERKDDEGHAKPFRPDKANPRRVEKHPFYQIAEVAEIANLKRALSAAAVTLRDQTATKEAPHESS